MHYLTMVWNILGFISNYKLTMKQFSKYQGASESNFVFIQKGSEAVLGLEVGHDW